MNRCRSARGLSLVEMLVAAALLAGLGVFLSGRVNSAGNLAEGARFEESFEQLRREIFSVLRDPQSCAQALRSAGGDVARFDPTQSPVSDLARLQGAGGLSVARGASRGASERISQLRLVDSGAAAQLDPLAGRARYHAHLIVELEHLGLRTLRSNEKRPFSVVLLVDTSSHQIKACDLHLASGEVASSAQMCAHIGGTWNAGAPWPLQCVLPP